MDRLPHLLERAATANVRDLEIDLGIGRVGLVLEQSRNRHDHAALAVAALRHVIFDPRLLHLVQRAVLREPLDGGDVLVHHHAHQHRAGAHRDAVDMDRAGPALRDPAAVLGAGQSDVLAQHPEQWGLGIDVELVLLAVDGERCHGRTCLERNCDGGRPGGTRQGDIYLPKYMRKYSVGVKSHRKKRRSPARGPW